jgi:hypothetical protein
MSSGTAGANERFESERAKRAALEKLQRHAIGQRDDAAETFQPASHVDGGTAVAVKQF